MAYGSRLVRLGIVLGLGVGLAACSTMDLRGRTQSVAVDHRASDRSLYAGRQGLVRSQSRRRFDRRPPQSAAHRDRRMASPSLNSYNRGRRPLSPGVQGNRQSFALPPRVERQSTPSMRQRATRPAPSNDPIYERSGWARWIGRSWLGHKTAAGEMFDANRLTGAHASLPLPSFVYVTNKRNGRTILIRVNDRVPAAKGRVIIVSQRAAELLDFRDAGRIQVDIQYGGPASPVPNEKHERAFLKQQDWYRGNRRTHSRRSPSYRLPAVRPARRYAQPTYPRWDNTRR